MRILFVCHGNVGRSQMAEAYYNALSLSADASSAGTDPESPRKYSVISRDICRVMAEDGIDVSRNRVKSITEKAVSEADRIYVLYRKTDCPAYLIASDKTIWWDIEDPYKKNLAQLRRIRDNIKSRVESILV